MSCITIDSGTRGMAGTREDGAERPGIAANLLCAALGLVSACRSAAALAMMSERDLDDLGLLPWEVGAELRQTMRRVR